MIRKVWSTTAYDKKKNLSDYIASVHLCLCVCEYHYQISWILFTVFIYNSNQNWIYIFSWKELLWWMWCQHFLFGLCACKYNLNQFLFYSTLLQWRLQIENEKNRKYNIWPMVNVWMNEWTLWHHLTLRLRFYARVRKFCAKLFQGTAASSADIFRNRKKILQKSARL